MTRFIMFFLAVGLVLVGCSTDKTNGNNEKNKSIIMEDISVAINTEITSSTEQNVLEDSPEYVTKNEGELFQDSDMAYEMCVRALTDFYKAVWNGSDIDLDSFIENESLKQYMQKKIQSQYERYAEYDEVQNIEVGAWEVEYTDDVDGGFLYFKLPADIKNTVGSRGEVTEFLVRNINGKLVIVDWYTGTKDGYDFMARGENLTIDNPNIWNDREWVEKLDNKQNEFSGSIR